VQDRQVVGTYPNGIAIDIGMSQSPSAVLFGGTFYVFHQGYGQNGQLWYTTYNVASGTWAPDQQVFGTDANGNPTNIGMSASPSAMVGPNGGIYVFHQGYGQNGQLWYTYSPDGVSWMPDQRVFGTDANGNPTNIGMSESPAAIVW
jgi:hypothetical protein